LMNRRFMSVTAADMSNASSCEKPCLGREPE
jgi:hypothetical protein